MTTWDGAVLGVARGGAETASGDGGWRPGCQLCTGALIGRSRPDAPAFGGCSRVLQVLHVTPMPCCMPEGRNCNDCQQHLVRTYGRSRQLSSAHTTACHSQGVRASSCEAVIVLEA